MEKKNIIIASVASLAVLAVTTYLIIRRRKAQKEAQPPAGVPQLNIQNPGDQSDFPAGPTGEPELG